MSDLVKRLRKLAEDNYEMLNDIHEPLNEAADEIERLLEACMKLADPDRIIVHTINPPDDYQRKQVLDDMREWAGTECPLPYTHEFLSCLLEYEKGRMK